MREWWFASVCMVSAALACGPLATAGCSGGEDSPAAPTDAAAEANDAAEEPTPDAGPGCTQDPHVYPAKHQPIPTLTNLGGPLLDHMKIVTVTFAGDAKRDSLRAFDHFIVSSQSAWWQETAGGYGAQAGTSGGDYEVPDTVSGKSITDADIQTWLQQMVDAGTATDDAGVSAGLPAPDAQTLYAIYYPHSTTISLEGSSSCTQFGAYHNSASIALEGGTIQAAYAVMPRCNYYNNAQQDWGVLTLSAAHEMVEAATDPHPMGNDQTYRLITDDSWGSGGAESADVCENLWDVAVDESGYQVPRVWSNAAALASKQPCQPAPSGKPVFYAAAVHTNDQMIDGRKQTGYLVIKRGKTVDLQLDVFAEKELPHDVLLYVGRDKGPGVDPAEMGKPEDGITATLSTATGVNNGDCETLTVSVPSNAVPGDFRVVVRAVLSKSDYNDWPLIIRVQ